MTIRKSATWILSAAVAVLAMGATFQKTHHDSDYDVLAKVKAQQSRAPSIDYPTHDLRGRAIPSFDYLMVMPDCQSCSEFRKKSRAFVEQNPNVIFLFATPDLVDIDDLLEKDNCYVYEFKRGSKLAEVPAGAYAK